MGIQAASPKEFALFNSLVDFSGRNILRNSKQVNGYNKIRSYQIDETVRSLVIKTIMMIGDAEFNVGPIYSYFVTTEPRQQ